MNAALTPSTPSFLAAPSAPSLALPAWSCDAHVHVFGPQQRFAFAPERTYTPCDAPKETLFALHRHLGVQRGVIVQANCHGFDNSAIADALVARPGAYRGVALLRTSVDDAELRRLDRIGFRAVRFNFMSHLGAPAPTDEILALAGRLAAIGWHLQIHCDAASLEPLSGWLKRSPVPVVIDHMARIDASLGERQPVFQTLIAMLRDDRFWVKISGTERISRQTFPHADAAPFARTLVGEFGDRVLWGSDWPHPNLSGRVPDDGRLVDLIERHAPSATQRHALLVDNPQRLFRFEDVAS
jgi:2-pyrone-4,6-dicarboxylate lactonase